MIFNKKLFLISLSILIFYTIILSTNSYACRTSGESCNTGFGLSCCAGLTWSIWVTINPHAGVDTCSSAGEKCMLTYCSLYAGNCQESSDTCAESFCCTGTC